MEIKIVERILSANESVAAENRALFAEKGVLAINVMGSPGAGKTSLIEAAIRSLRGRLSATVIEGDIASTKDAQRIAALGVPVVQIATGGECHLDAAMVKQALEQLDLVGIDILFIENVGNLVCPAEFDLGETRRLVVSSVPEGDDKVEKYPQIFHTADAVVLNKIDLMGGSNFNLQAFRSALGDVKPGAAFVSLSCTTDAGLSDWTDLLLSWKNP